jgi:hypothetical protein
MLTGDNAATAPGRRGEAGIARFEAEVLPGDKAAAVNKLKAAGRLVGMAGDGINDAPALAAADVSFAMAAGSDVAMQAADVTLMRDDLGSVADAISLSRATLAKIRQNLFFAFIYNVLGIPLAALGMLNPVIAGAAMAELGIGGQQFAAACAWNPTRTEHGNDDNQGGRHVLRRLREKRDRRAHGARRRGEGGGLAGAEAGGG